MDEIKKLSSWIGGFATAIGAVLLLLVQAGALGGYVAIMLFTLLVLMFVAGYGARMIDSTRYWSQEQTDAGDDVAYARRYS